MADAGLELLYGVVDDVGLDVDRFRIAEGAGEDGHYLTGIEFALGAAAWLTARFIKRFLKGVEEEARAAGLDPEQLGERAGRRTFKQLLDASEALGGRARARLQASEPDTTGEAAEIGDVAQQLLLEAGTIETETLEPDRRNDWHTGQMELEAALEEQRFDAERAAQVAQAVATRLAGATAQP